jgi:DnaK suppressor protein
MDSKTIAKFKKILEKDKASIEKQLKSFAKKDLKLKGDYDTRYPDLGTHQSVDEMAQEVSMYESSLPVEHTLELKLRDIDAALDKVVKGSYGICENCKEEIPAERLKTKPEAKYCIKCKAKITGSRAH